MAAIHPTGCISDKDWIFVMATMIEMQAQQQEALNKANAAITPAERAGRNLTTAESETYNAAMEEFRAIGRTMAAKQEQNTLHAAFFGPNRRMDPAALLGAAPGENPTRPFAMPQTNPVVRSAEYATAFHRFVASKGTVRDETLLAGFDGQEGFVIPGSELYTRQRLANGMPVLNAALTEGTLGSSGAAGGYAISVPTADLTVELALPDQGIFNAATVIPTATDMKIPRQATMGTSSLKTEGSAFGTGDPTLATFTLSAWMAGRQVEASWELLQDAPSFQKFIVDDLLKSQQILEGGYFATGTGTSQPQGVVGNTGNGTGSAYALTGTAATDAQTLINSLYDVTGTVKAFYQPNASWVMSRATAMAIRRAQTQSNLYIPVIRQADDGTVYVLDRPVYFDSNMPSLPTATTAGVTPIIFGDWKQGYVVGVRGGGGVNVKILDQVQAINGQLVILAYRRIDGRVRQPEALQGISISHS